MIKKSISFHNRHGGFPHKLQTLCNYVNLHIHYFIQQKGRNVYNLCVTK